MISKKLFHYSSAVKIDNIIKTNKIWLTHILDYDKGNNIEMFLKPYYFEVVERLKNQNPDNPFYTQLPDKFQNIYSDGIIKDLVDIVFEKSILKEGKFETEVGYVMPFDIKCYILCLSSDKENTYLKSYYSNGSDKLLEIDTDKFVNQCKNQITKTIQNKVNFETKKYEIKLGGNIRKNTRNKDYISLGKDYIEFKEVIYKKDDKINMIEKIIKYYNDKMIANKINIEYSKYVNLLMYELFLEALFFKEEGFCLEKESRLVIMCPTDILDILAPSKGDIGKKIAISYEDSIKIIDLI